MYFYNTTNPAVYSDSEQISQKLSSSSLDSSGIGTSLTSSPSMRFPSRPEFLDDTLRELERHTAYERAKEDLERDLLNARLKSVTGIDADLRNLLGKMRQE